MSEYELLPTGKPHVSFSEIREWDDCSWRHKIKHVMHIDLSKPSPIPGSGTAVHASCEDYLKTRVMKPEIAIAELQKLFAENAGAAGFEEEKLQGYIDSAIGVLAEVPAWLDENFPNWEYVDAEHMLYEGIEGQPHAFKGFIDGIIQCDGAKGKRVTWLIDWKFTGFWSADKKSDPKVTAQLIYYKHFWATKTATPMKDVRCGFVLLKRSGKPGTRIELVPVSVGDVSVGKSLKVINNMLSSMKKGLAFKNKQACTYCDFKKTEWCP